MIKTFKDIFFGYIAALALGMILTLYVLPAGVPRGVRIGLFILVILVSAGISTWLTQRRILSCNEPLENCRLREGLRILSGMEKKLYDRNNRVMFRLNRATAEIDLGEYEEALDILKNTDVPDKHSLREMTLMAIYEYNMALAKAELGELDDAELHITTLDYILGDLKFREPMLSRMIRNSKMAKQRLAVLRGDHEGAIEAYEGFERDAETLRVRIRCRYRMAEEYLHAGKLSDVRSLMEYVADYGGDSIYAVKAEEYLEGLDQSADAEPDEPEDADAPETSGGEE